MPGQGPQGLLGVLNSTPAAGPHLGLATNQTGPQCLEVPVPDGLLLSLGLVSLVENLLVVAAIAGNRRLRAPTHLLIGGLAASDLLVSCSDAVQTAVTLLLQAGAPAAGAAAVRRLGAVVDALVCGSMLSSLCFPGAIAVDRYISVFYALRYHSIVTLPRARRALAAVWGASVLAGALSAAYDDRVAVPLCLVGFFAAVLALMAVLYAHMLARARRHARGTARQGSGLKGTATLALLLGIFLLCWGPFFLRLLLTVLCPQHPVCGCVFRNSGLVVVLRMCSALADPLIYAFRRQELRKTLREALPLCRPGA